MFGESFGHVIFGYRRLRLRSDTGALGDLAVPGPLLAQGTHLETVVRTPVQHGSLEPKFPAATKLSQAVFGAGAEVAGLDDPVSDLLLPAKLELVGEIDPTCVVKGEDLLGHNLIEATVISASDRLVDEFSMGIRDIFLSAQISQH